MLVLCTLAASSGVAAARTLAEIRAAYLAIADTLPCGGESGEPEWVDPSAPERPGDPGLRLDMQATLKSVWPLVGEWAAAFLDRHPRAPAAALGESFRQLGPTTACPENEYGDWRWLRVSAVQLVSGRDAAYAVATDQTFSGTVFVVSRQKGGRFRVAWTVKDVPRQGIEESEKIAWKEGIRDWEDGPLHGGVTLLSRSANGHARFMVDASPLGIVVMGCTQTFQLSLWEWDGSQASPLLMKPYCRSICDDDVGRRGHGWQGDTLRLPVKGRLATMSPLGGDVHPRAVWMIRVTGAGVEDLGEEWDEPDLRFVDGVLARVLRQEDTADVIDTGVAVDLYRRLAPIAHLPDAPNLGSYGSFAVRQAGDGRVATMKGGARGEVAIEFTIVEREGRRFVTAATVRTLE